MVPLTVGVLSLVAAPAATVPVVGATSSLTLVMLTVLVGAVMSSTIERAVEVGPLLPALSTTRAV